MKTKEFWIIRLIDKKLFQELPRAHQLKLLSILKSTEIFGIPCLAGIIELDHIELDDLRSRAQKELRNGFFYRVIDRDDLCRRALRVLMPQYHLETEPPIHQDDVSEEEILQSLNQSS